MRVLLLALLLSVTTSTFAVDVRVKIEGDLGDSLTLLQALNVNAKDSGLHFVLADSGYDYRIATRSEPFKSYGLIASNGAANASAAVLDPDCKLLFIVARNGRGTQKGALNAVAKEIDKRLVAYRAAMAH